MNSLFVKWFSLHLMYCVLVNIFVFIILVSNVYSDVRGNRAEGDVELPSDRGMIKGLISELSTLKYAPYIHANTFLCLG